MTEKPKPSARSMRRTLGAGIAALLIASSGPALAQTTSDFAVVDDVTIYLAVLPAEMLRTYPPGSEESRMHGGVPGGRHVHHVQIALFDAQTSARISDARVTVTVAELGLAGSRAELEPFVVGDALTYGGYFEFQTRDLYEIRVTAELPEAGQVVNTTFEYRHQ
tara:strand:- start:3723 stop:4214 length:492 start_codon:yes stop_codon:yes gene_type:complete